MSKIKWTILILSGLIIVVSENIWLAKRDAKMLSSPPQSEVIVYKQLPVIPFAE